jgi:hypothetical protein
VTTTCCLAETRCEPGDGAELRVLDAAGPCGFMSRNVEEVHDSGYGHDVLALFRYDSGGTLTPLTVHRTGSDRDHEDWLSWHLEVCAADAAHSDGGYVAEASFTVRIDGRA